jgi:hypothetical protein
MVSIATALMTAPTTPIAIGDLTSEPAVTPWIVASRNSGKLARWTVRHARRGSRFFASDVASIATSRYMPTMPHAIATGRQWLAKGTSTASRVKCT